MNYVALIPTHACGIPCTIAVIDWEPYVPAYISGPPENCYPAEGGYGEWVLLDRRGRRAEWLERKLTASDESEIAQQVFDHMERAQEDYLCD